MSYIHNLIAKIIIMFVGQIPIFVRNLAAPKFHGLMVKNDDCPSQNGQELLA